MYRLLRFAFGIPWRSLCVHLHDKLKWILSGFRQKCLYWKYVFWFNSIVYFWHILLSFCVSVPRKCFFFRFGPWYLKYFFYICFYIYCNTNTAPPILMVFALPLPLPHSNTFFLIQLRLSSRVSELHAPFHRPKTFELSVLVQTSVLWKS